MTTTEITRRNLLRRDYHPVQQRLAANTASNAGPCAKWRIPAGTSTALQQVASRSTPTFHQRRP